MATGPLYSLDPPLRELTIKTASLRFLGQRAKRGPSAPTMVADTRQTDTLRTCIRACTLNRSKFFRLRRARRGLGASSPFRVPPTSPATRGHAT